MEQIGSYLSLGILVLAIYCIFFGFIYGLKRGLGKATFRLITIVIALVGAIIVTNIAGGVILSNLDGVTVEEAIRGFLPEYDTALDEQTRNILANFEGETAQYVLSLPLYIVIAPIAFVVIFYVLKLITLIVFWILSAIFGFLKRKKTGLSRLGGGAIGIVQGLIIAIITLVPLCGMLGVATDIKPAITADTVSEDIKTNVETAYNDIIDPVASSPAMSIASNAGGTAIYKLITSVTLGDNGYNMYDETVKMGVLIGDTLAFGTDFDWKNPEPWRETISHMIADIGDNRYISVVISGVLRTGAGSIEDGLIELPEEEPYKSVADDIIAIFKTSNADNLEGDLVTLASVYDILGKHDVLVTVESGDMDEITDSLTRNTSDGRTVVSLVIEELKKNDRTKPLTASMAKISVALMCNKMNINEDATELYEDVKVSVNDILAIDKESFLDEEGNVDENAYVAAVTEQLDEALQSHDIVLEKEVVSGMADFINKNFSEIDEITDEQINDVILSYYDAYANYLESGNPDDLPDEVPDLSGPLNIDDLGGEE